VNPVLLRTPIPQNRDPIKTARSKVRLEEETDRIKWEKWGDKPRKVESTEEKLARLNRYQGGSATSSFRNLQSDFLHRHKEAILEELGPDVFLVPANLSENVQNSFLHTVKEQGFLPTFGYHGTREKNIPSILKQGLMIPGPESGLSITNGRHQGVGIYSATPGNSWIAHWYANTSKIFVCGVLDPKVPVQPGSKYVETPLQDRGGEIRVAEGGNVRVMTNDKLIAPLYIAANAKETEELLNPQETQFLNKPKPELVAKRQVQIAGQPDAIWVPPACIYRWNAIRVKRRFVAKHRDLVRAAGRAEKEHLRGFA